MQTEVQAYTGQTKRDKRGDGEREHETPAAAAVAVAAAVVRWAD